MIKGLETELWRLHELLIRLTGAWHNIDDGYTAVLEFATDNTIKLNTFKRREKK